MKPNSPCLNCVDRYYKCHVYCDKYLGFKQELNEFKTMQNISRQEYLDSIGYEVDKRKRLNKYKK